jgi:hypothetical protein
VQHQITTLSKLVVWDGLEVEDVKQLLKNVKSDHGSIFQSLRLVGSSLLQSPATLVSNAAQGAHNMSMRS